MWKHLLLLLVLGVSLGFCRHLRTSRHVHHGPRREHWRTEPMKIDGMTVDMLRAARPSGFAPVNNIIFFKKYKPCEDGMKRDLFGICREVWDD